MKTLTVNNVRLHVYDEGQGDPILFVHGFPLNHSMWDAQLKALAATHRVIAPDLRGFGSSDVTAGTVTMEQLADDCAALLDALGVREPINFCGLSMGGYVAWQFVRKYGHRLHRLILCDTRAAADTPEAAATRLKMAEHVTTAGVEMVAKAMTPKLFARSTIESRPEVVEAVQQMMLATKPEGIAAAQRGMAARLDMRDLLPSVNLPTLVIVGVEDAISTVDEMRDISDTIPTATFRSIPNAGHMSPMENPAAVNAALTAFLAQK
jgi:3-oxoadipate enol-lactonase